MHTFRWNPTHARLFCLGLLILSISSLPISNVAAESPPGTGPDGQPKTVGYYIFINRYSKRLCVGQKATLTLTFGSIDPLLQPLAPISSIDVDSTINTVDPTEIKPMNNSGTADVVYTAKKEGTDRVVTLLYNYNYAFKHEVSAAQDETTIEVREKCKYHFSLESEMNTTMAKGGSSVSISYQIEAEGDLVESDPPGTLKASGVEVTVWAKITAVTDPSCKLISQDPGYGTGMTDATAVITGDGQYVTLSLGPLRNFNFKKVAVGRCGDQTKSADVSVIKTYSGPLMAGDDFASSGGSLPVTLDVFEQGKKNYETHGGTASYWALMTLRMVE